MATNELGEPLFETYDQLQKHEFEQTSSSVPQCSSPIKCEGSTFADSDSFSQKTLKTEFDDPPNCALSPDVPFTIKSEPVDSLIKHEKVLSCVSSLTQADRDKAPEQCARCLQMVHPPDKFDHFGICERLLPFACSLCKRAFDAQWALTGHIRALHHNADIPRRGHIFRPSAFVAKPTLGQHKNGIRDPSNPKKVQRIININNTANKCARCASVFASEGQAQRHARLCHLVDPYQCVNYDTRSVSKASHSKHLSQCEATSKSTNTDDHSKGPSILGQAVKLDEQPSVVEKELKAQPDFERYHECPAERCGLHFTRLALLNAHIDRAHRANSLRTNHEMAQTTTGRRPSTSTSKTPEVRTLKRKKQNSGPDSKPVSWHDRGVPPSAVQVHCAGCREHFNSADLFMRHVNTRTSCTNMKMWYQCRANYACNLK